MGEIMTSLKVYRNTGWWFPFRDIKLFVDDVERIALHRGAVVQLPVAPGTHEAYVRAGTTGSPTVSFIARDDELVELEIRKGLTPGVGIDPMTIYRLESRESIDSSKPRDRRRGPSAKLPGILGLLWIVWSVSLARYVSSEARWAVTGVVIAIELGLGLYTYLQRREHVRIRE